MKSYFIYTDASFSQKQQMGVSGFFIFNNSKDHETHFIDLAKISLNTFEEKNNIRAEFRGVMSALEILEARLQKNDFTITLYTDCQAIVNLIKRRKKLESADFKSHRKKSILSNADIYKEFFLLYDRLKPRVIWVKGHSPSENQDRIHKNFSAIDKAVRGELRRNKK